jgi:hypothetical protein
MSKRPSCLFSLAKLSSLVVAAGIASSLAAGKARALATWIGSWDYVLRQDQDGKPQAAFARLRGDDEALLWLTCSRAPADGDLPHAMSMAAAISQKSYLGQSSRRGRSTVFWFDDGSPELGYWIYRDRVGQIADTEQVAQFLDKLVRAQTLVVELSNYRLETQRSEFQFDAADTKVVAERFRQDCRDIANLASGDISSIR